MDYDLFDENLEVPQEKIVERPIVVEESSGKEIDSTRPQMLAAKIIQNMLSESAKIQSKQAELDALKLARQAEFLIYAEGQGFSGKGIVDLLKYAIELAKKNEDSRALTRLTELVNKTMMEPASDLSKFFIQLQQNNIKMTSKNGDKALEDASALLNSVPEHVLKKFLADKLQEMLSNEQ